MNKLIATALFAIFYLLSIMVVYVAAGYAFGNNSFYLKYTVAYYTLWFINFACFLLWEE